MNGDETNTGQEPPVEEPPSQALLWTLTAIWLGTAALLFWLGFVLDPSDADATDGLQRLLFAIVPIKVFAWVMSVVFLGIGAATARGALKGPAEVLASSAEDPPRLT